METRRRGRADPHTFSESEDHVMGSSPTGATEIVKASEPLFFIISVFAKEKKRDRGQLFCGSCSTQSSCGRAVITYFSLSSSHPVSMVS